MTTFQVGKDFQPEHAGAGNGAFQIHTLKENNGNNITNRINVGIVHQSDEDLKNYLAKTLGLDSADIHLEIL